jgi:hypothetical protein
MDDSGSCGDDENKVSEYKGEGTEIFQMLTIAATRIECYHNSSTTIDINLYQYYWIWITLSLISTT